MRAGLGGPREHYSHLYVTFAKSSLNITSLSHIEGRGWHGGYHNVQRRKYFHISQFHEQVMPGPLLCAIPKCAMQPRAMEKYLAKISAGDCGAPLSNLIAEYLFSALCTGAQYHLAHVKIKLSPSCHKLSPASQWKGKVSSRFHPSSLEWPRCDKCLYKVFIYLCSVSGSD